MESIFASARWQSFIGLGVQQFVMSPNLWTLTEMGQIQIKRLD
jgi:hypothetical protein